MANINKCSRAVTINSLFIGEERTMLKKNNNLLNEQRAIADKIKSELKKDLKNCYSRKRIAKKKNIVMVIIGILSLACITLMTVTNYYIFINIPSNIQIADEIYSSTLLSDGLAIIAIAISVWAGLNIVNAIERKELDDANDRIAEVENKISIEEYKLEDTSAKIKSLSEGVQDTQKSLSFMFENELIKTIKDRATLYLYNKFSSMNFEEKNNYNVYYQDMTIIEQFFIRVYETHSSKQLKDIELEYIAEKGIEMIDDIIEKDSDSIPALFLIYLRYRKAEFNYYLGYITEDPQKYYNSFIKAAELFIELCSDFNAWIPKYDSIKEIPEYMGKEEYREISMYFANSIGDAYSRFVLYSDISGRVFNKNGEKLGIDEVVEIGRQGVFYCSCAAKWTNQDEGHEVYYRNLGCAYERLEEKAIGKYYREIIYNYNMAFESIANCHDYSYRVQSVYHTLIQYLKKYLDKVLKISYVFQDLISFDESIGSTIKLNEENARYLKMLYFITDFAKSDNHRYKLQYSVNGLTLAIILYYKLNNDNLIEEICDLPIDDCFQIMNEDINILCMMGISEKDSYFKELNKRYKIIKEYLG